MEAGALIDLRLGPNAAAVLVHNPLNRRQANSGPLKVLGAMQALKSPE